MTRNKMHKAVEWAYPTSSNAAKFGFGASGCWTVEIGEKGKPMTAIAGYATREEAVARALTEPEPWSAISLKFNNEDGTEKTARRDWSEFIEWDNLNEEQRTKVRDVHSDLAENEYADYVWRFSPEDELIGFTKSRCELCGHGADDPITDCEHEPGETHGPIIDGKCAPCREGLKALAGGEAKTKRQRKNTGIANPIVVNARYYLLPAQNPEADAGALDVIDRMRELRYEPITRIFCNASEQECRDWITRNCEEPVEHARAPYRSRNVIEGNVHSSMPCRIEIIAAGGTIITDLTLSVAGDEEHNAEQRANAALFTASPKLLALLEQYHEAMPTLESGALIAEARGWT